MENDIFCKIVRGEIPSFKIWEDKDFLAILDINPNVEGMTVLLSKDHYDSYMVESMGEEMFGKMFVAAQKVAKLLDEALGTKRTAIVMEGLGVNHAHLKLYPIYGLEQEFEETWAKEKVYFEKYPGYITTQLGQQADFAKLKALAEKIKQKIK
jgi:diadenosine tetraphosphate (Ap4A) HIT family hydrolase